MSGGIYLHHIVDSGLFSVEEINNLLSVNVLENILGTNSSGTRSYSQPVAANTSELHTLVPFIQSHYKCFYFSTEEGPTPHTVAIKQVCLVI